MAADLPGVETDDRTPITGALALSPRAWQVTTRRRADCVEFAAPADFGRGAAADMPDDGSIYTLDPITGAAWLCDVPYRDLVGQPFSYATQAARARVIGCSPVADLPRDPGRPVIGIFSIGRCGSTLLSRILDAAGAAVLNELDAFTALGQASRRWPADRAIQAQLSAMARGALAHVADAAPSGDLVLKFRSQALQAARAIVAAGVRPVLLTRRFDDWAASAARQFPDDPVEGRLDATLRGLEDIAALSQAPRVLDYDRMLSDPVAAAELCLGRPVPPARHDAIRACLSRHSQRGTALDRPRADPAPADLGRAAALWHDRADPRALERLGLGPDLLPLTQKA